MAFVWELTKESIDLPLGCLQGGKSGATFTTVNPSTEQIICRVSEAKEEDVDAAVDAAVRAFLPSSAAK